MRQKHRLDDKRHHQKQRARPTIGLLIVRLDDEGYHTEIWSGITALAREQGANLFTIVGGIVRSLFDFESQQNILYELVSAQNVDGLIIISSVGQHISFEEFQNFCKNYRPLPMVMLSIAHQGIPSIVVDNSKGIRDGLIHLIETHGYRRIAFIRGPEGDGDGEERYRTYTQVLAEYGLPFDPELVVPGNYLVESGKHAINLLLDQRQVKFEAVMVANDNMALGALEALQVRGIYVPDEVAIVGFDDITASRCTPPPLTTVRQPLYELGQQAVWLMLAQLQGEAVPERLVLGTMTKLSPASGARALARR